MKKHELTSINHHEPCTDFKHHVPSFHQLAMWWSERGGKLTTHRDGAPGSRHQLGSSWPGAGDVGPWQQCNQWLIFTFMWCSMYVNVINSELNHVGQWELKHGNYDQWWYNGAEWWLMIDINSDSCWLHMHWLISIINLFVMPVKWMVETINDWWLMLGAC